MSTPPPASTVTPPTAATTPATSTRTVAGTDPSRTPAPPTPGPTPTAARFDFPVPVEVGDAQQVITVQVSGRSDTEGTLTAWQQTGRTWRPMFGPVHAWLGSAGIGPSSESSSRTPEGTYLLTEAFGRNPDPGSGLPYRQLDDQDWWVSDVNSPDYNTHQRCAAGQCGFDTGASEHLVTIDPEYDYAAVIDVNRDPVVAGDGSAFFLHVEHGEPTAGCVAIDQGTLVDVLRWLQPGGHPRIAVGVG